MKDIRERLEALGAAIPELLLPAAGVDLEAWAVIACDQFTQDRAYWRKAEERVGSAPSTLRMILPEIFLEDGDRAARIESIRKAMRGYLEHGIFAPSARGVLYIERSTPFRGLRRGLVLAVDLERYEWSPESRPLIRATEGTVKERIPPRMEIRRDAPLEAPHVILLIDDDERTLIEGLGARAKRAGAERAGTERTGAERSRARRSGASYSTSLMLGAGTISGWLLDSEADAEYLAAGLERLAEKARSRYAGDAAGAPGAGTAAGSAATAPAVLPAGAPGAASAGEAADPFLFAVGDGNHSLATAKAVWDEFKAAHPAEAARTDHPARWALVEVENIYDEGIEFEPIHRALFGANVEEVLIVLSALPDFSAREIGSDEELARLVADGRTERTRFGLASGLRRVLVETSESGLSTHALQPILDAFVAGKPSRSIDYLHGTEETLRVGSAPGAVGILLPPVGKSELFATVAKSGPLPRKSFSMGEAIEKRFYLECRKLFG